MPQYNPITKQIELTEEEKAYKAAQGFTDSTNISAPPVSVTGAPATPVGMTPITTESTQKVPTQEYKNLQLQQDILTDDQVRAGVAQTKVDVEKAKAEQDKAVADQKIAGDIAKQQQDAVAAANTDYTRAKGERELQYQNLKNMKYTDFFGDNTGKRIGAGIAIALGSYGAAMTGRSSNDALTIINNAIESDFNRQKAEVLKQEKVLGEAEKGMQLSEHEKQMKLADIELNRAAAYDIVAKDVETKKRQQGVPEAQIKGDQTVLALQQNAIKTKLDAEEKFATVKKTEATDLGAYEKKEAAKSRGENAGKPTPSSEAQKAVDTEFGKDYAEYTAAGGKTDTKKSIIQLKLAAKKLKDLGESKTSQFLGLGPKEGRDILDPKRAAVEDAIAESAQRNLRKVLGAQFTEREGNALLSRVYNPRQSQAENSRRLDRLIEQIQAAALEKERAAAHYEKNGTMKNYKGTPYSLKDFEPETSKETKDETKTVKGVTWKRVPGGWEEQ